MEKISPLSLFFVADKYTWEDETPIGLPEDEENGEEFPAAEPDLNPERPPEGEELEEGFPEGLGEEFEGPEV